MKPVLFLLLILAAPAAATAPLGRLFFTPDERAMLDAPTAHTAGGPAVTRRLDGIASSSAGRHTVWLDGEAQTPPKGWQVTGHGRLRIAIPNASPRHLVIGDEVDLGPVKGTDDAPGSQPLAIEAGR